MKPEHYSAVVFAYKDKLTMSISIAVGSSIVSGKHTIDLIIWSLPISIANCPLCHSFVCDFCMDVWEATFPSVWSIWDYCEYRLQFFLLYLLITFLQCLFLAGEVLLRFERCTSLTLLLKFLSSFGQLLQCRWEGMLILYIICSSL